MIKSDSYFKYFMQLERDMRVVVSGSFRRLEEEYKETVDILRNKIGYVVLGAKEGVVINPGDNFLRFAKDDPNTPDRILEAEHLLQYYKANFQYVVNEDGLIGRGTATEMLFAMLCNLPIIISRPIDGFTEDVPEVIRPYIERGITRVIPIENISIENNELGQILSEPFERAILPEERVLLIGEVRNYNKTLSLSTPATLELAK